MASSVSIMLIPNGSIEFVFAITSLHFLLKQNGIFMLNRSAKLFHMSMSTYQAVKNSKQVPMLVMCK